MALIKNQDQVQIINDLIADLASSMRIRPVHISFNDLWNSAPPAESQGEGLEEYMKDVKRGNVPSN